MKRNDGLPFFMFYITYIVGCDDSAHRIERLAHVYIVGEHIVLPRNAHIERVLGRTWCAPAVRQGADELQTV